jgi:hypothetical protein
MVLGIPRREDGSSAGGGGRVGLEQNCAVATGGGRSRWVTWIFVFAALLYAASVSRYWHIGTDSALFVRLARQLATGGGYSHGVPPVVPLGLALAYKASHVIEPGIKFLDTFLYFNAFEALAAFAGLVAAYLLAAQLSSRRHAAMVAALLATSFAYYALAVEPLTDVPYCAVSWAAILFAMRSERGGGWPDKLAAAAFLALAPLTRVAGGALVLAAVGVYGARALRRTPPRRSAVGSLLLTVPAVAATIAVGIFIVSTDTGEWHWSYVNDLTAREPASIPRQIAANAVILPARLLAVVMGRGNFALPGLAVGAVAALGFVSFWRRRTAALVCIYVLIYVISLLVPNYRLSGRYLVPLLPFVFLFLMDGLAILAAWLARLLSQRGGGQNAFRSAAVERILRRAGAVVLAAVIAANLVSVGAALVPRFSTDFYKSYQGGYYEDYLALAEGLRAKAPPGPVMAARNRVIAALCDRPAVQVPYRQFLSHRPDVGDTSQYVRARGVKAIVVDPRNAESAAILMRLIENGPFTWRKEAQFGVLTLYVLDETSH